MKSSNSSIYVFLVFLSWVLWLVLMWFVLVGNFWWKRGKYAISVQCRSSPPRRRELCLCEKLRLGEGVLA